jgi:hypothetical protein
MNTAAEAIVVQKTPTAEWDQAINWGCPSRELGNDFILSSSWAVTGPDSALILSDPEVSTNNKVTTIWLSEGTLGAFYNVTNTIVTQGGRTLQGTFIVSIVEYLWLIQPRVI